VSLVGNANLLAGLCVAPLRRAGYQAELLDQLRSMILDHLVEKALASAQGDTNLASGLLLKASNAIAEPPLRETTDQLYKRKSSQLAVSYVSPSRSNEKCKDCSMFLLPLGSCTAVDGSISPDGWCRLFEPRTDGE
jgi:hypothetical protein